MTAMVDRLNSSEVFCLDVRATRSELLIDPLEEVTGLRVDVVVESEEQLNDTLDIEDPVSCILRIWVRKKLTALTTDQIDPMKLLVRQIFQRVNNFNSADGRVKVWEVDIDGHQVPDKQLLHESWLFVAAIVLRVEVSSSL